MDDETLALSENGGPLSTVYIRGNPIRGEFSPKHVYLTNFRKLPAKLDIWIMNMVKSVFYFMLIPWKKKMQKGKKIPCTLQVSRSNSHFLKVKSTSSIVGIDHSKSISTTNTTKGYIFILIQ